MCARASYSTVATCLRPFGVLAHRRLRLACRDSCTRGPAGRESSIGVLGWHVVPAVPTGSLPRWVAAARAESGSRNAEIMAQEEEGTRVAASEGAWDVFLGGHWWGLELGGRKSLGGRGGGGGPWTRREEAGALYALREVGKGPWPRSKGGARGCLKPGNPGTRRDAWQLASQVKESLLYLKCVCIHALCT